MEFVDMLLGTLGANFLGSILISGNRKIKKNRRFRYIYQNDIDKVCFQQDMVYGTYKDLPRGRAFHKLSHDHIFESHNPKYDRYQQGPRWFTICLTKRLGTPPTQKKKSLRTNQ